ncbi:NUDIX domain-containing protein [Paracoccus pantotrophus]|nr:NUDIX domain-containing protein [Paracoccus pantotrophus]
MPFQQPGGRISAGETAAAALCRELAEETGLRVDAGQMRALGRFRARAANEPGRQVDADLFLLHLPEETEIVPAPRSPRHAGSIRHATTFPSRR